MENPKCLRTWGSGPARRPGRSTTPNHERVDVPQESSLPATTRATIPPAYSLARGFEFDGHDLRVEFVEGQPWWVAADLADALGYKHAPHMTRSVDDDGELIRVRLVDTNAGPRSMAVLSMAGMWEVLAASRKPKAKALRRYMTTVVMPAVQTRGGYVHPEAVAAGVTIGDLSAPADPVPSDLELARQCMAMAALAERSILERDAARAQIREDAPKVAACDAFIDSSRDYSMREAALLIQREDGVAGTIGERRLFEALVRWSMISGQRSASGKTVGPYVAFQHQVNCGRLVMAPGRVHTRGSTTGPDGRDVPKVVIGEPSVRVTAKGVAHIRAKLEAERKQEAKKALAESP